MKKLLVIALCFTAFISCKNDKVKSEEMISEKIDFASFGAEITADEAISKDMMSDKFKSLEEGDTISVKFATKINEVCKSKGCWMKLDLGNEEESMVRFKDYDFFVPMDADNKEVVVNGKAFVTKISVKELQHYAKDAGKSEEEIAAITAPEFTYAIEADGVLVEK